VRALKFQGKRLHTRLLGTLRARERLSDAAPLLDRSSRCHCVRCDRASAATTRPRELARYAARIALVDDVITTGSTAGAAAALRAAGASGVELWVVARVARRQPASQV
jgi:hypothetical protein